MKEFPLSKIEISSILPDNVIKVDLDKDLKMMKILLQSVKDITIFVPMVSRIKASGVSNTTNTDVSEDVEPVVYEEEAATPVEELEDIEGFSII